MGEIKIGNRRDLVNPFFKPDTSGLVPNITGVAPDDLKNQSLVPGDIVLLDGTTVGLSFDHEISGFAGTASDPIWILGNNSTFEDKTVELFNNEWVYFENINFNNATNTGLKIEDSENCIYSNFALDGMGANGVRVDGTTTRPNNRLAFFDFNITNWGGSDGFSLHASASEENNGSNFVIRNLTCQNPVDTGEDGLDLTSGNYVYVWGYRGTDARMHVAHGVENIYVWDFVHNFDATSLRNQSIEIRNTDGDIWMGMIRGNGQIDLGVQSGPRSNESPNSTLTPNYITYELQLWDNLISGGVDNNTSGLGTIETPMTYNKLGFLEYSGFIRWPYSI